MHTNLDDFSAFIKQSKTTTDINQYQINKIARVLALVKQTYGEVFGSANPIDEISKVWLKSMGRTGIINLKTIQDEKVKLMLVHSIIKGIVESYKAQGKARAVKAMIVIPNSVGLIGKENSLVLQNEIKELLIEGAQYGVG